MEKLISVIIPVYQAERYLFFSIQSVLMGAPENMELILVDDGSTDGSLKICKEYAEKDSRVKVYHQRNMGVSAARNTGMQMASGEYVMFLDADDTLVSKEWKHILSLARENQYDFVAFSYYSLREKGKKTEEKFPMEQETCSDYDFLMELLMGSPLLCTCWGKLFRKSIIQMYAVQFPPRMAIGEDYLFVMEYLKHSAKTILVNKSIVNYYQNSDSAMGNFKLDQRMQCMKRIWEYGREYTNEDGYEKYACCFKKQQFFNVSYYARIICQSMKKQEAQAALKLMLSMEFVHEILGMMDWHRLSGYRKGEYFLLKSGKVRLIWNYYKIKSILKTEQL